MEVKTFDGTMLLLTLGAFGYIMTLISNRRMRRALRHVVQQCTRCGGSGELIIGGDCSQCREAREALSS